MIYNARRQGERIDYLTSSEIAKLHGIEKCRVDPLAREGRIEGAMLFGKSRMIPKAAMKVADGRQKCVLPSADRSGNATKKCTD